MQPRRRRKFGWQRGGKPTKSGSKKLREREENILGTGGSENVVKSEKVDCKGRLQNAAKTIESEMPEQRADRLNVVRQNTTEAVASETAEEREIRLLTVRTNATARIESESVPEWEERLEVARESARERANNVSFQEEHVDSREQYLHQGGWKYTDNPLHEQECVRNKMGSFHSNQEC